VSVEGNDELLAFVRRRLAAHGMSDRAVDATSMTPIGPPDPLPWALDDRPDAATVVQRALARSVARLLAHDPVVRLDLDIEGVHQMRVATRRLRSDLRTFADLLEELPDGLEDDLRWLAGLLGEVRDRDVLHEGLDDSIRHLDPADRKFTNSLAKRVGRERDAAATRLDMAMESVRYHHVVEVLVDLANRPPFRDEAHKGALNVLLPGAQRAWRGLRRAARRAGADEATADDVHALRIRAKRFRYALDALVDVEPAAAAHAELVADLQQVLGEFNDAVVAEGWLRAVAAGEDDPRRMFVLGQLVMAERAVADARRAKWPDAWKPVRTRKRREWLDG
jgi:CHAD domain-containing protein